MLRGIGRDGLSHVAADLRETGLHVVVLLRVVIAGNPPGSVVARHGELRVLLLDDEVVQVLAQRELIAEAESVVVETETDSEVALLCLLMQGDEQFVVVVADVTRLTPNGLPCLIEGSSLLVCERKAALQVGLTGAGCTGSSLCRVFLVRIGFQFQTELGRVDDCLSLIREVVYRLTLSGEREGHLHLSVGRCQTEFVGCKG